MSDPQHIRVRGISVRYGTQEILHGLDLDVAQGEFVSLVGKSGSGKSTLLHALAGFIPSAGEIKMPTDVGVVFQNYAVYPWLTVEGNLSFGLRSNFTREQRRDKIAKMLDLLDLKGHRAHYPGQLSGGQEQRVALGRAFAPDPEAVFMDEPFGALDFFTREKMQRWLMDLWEREHKTVLFVTHSVEEAIFISDRVIVLGQGIILGQFKVPYARPRVDTVKFESSFTDLKQEIITCMEQQPVGAPSV